MQQVLRQGLAKLVSSQDVAKSEIRAANAEENAEHLAAYDLASNKEGDSLLLRLEMSSGTVRNIRFSMKDAHNLAVGLQRLLQGALSLKNRS